MGIVFQISDWQAIKLTFEAPIGIWGKIDRMVRSHKISDKRDNLVEVGKSTHHDTHGHSSRSDPHIAIRNPESDELELTKLQRISRFRGN